MTQSPDNTGGPPTAGRSPGDEDNSVPLITPPPDAWHFPPEPAPPAEPGPGPGPAPAPQPQPAGVHVPYGTSPHYGTPPARGGLAPHGRPTSYDPQPYGTTAPSYPGGRPGPDPMLAEWWRRLLGRLIDVLAVGILLLPVSIPLLSGPFSKLEQITSQYPDLAVPGAQTAFSNAEGKLISALWTVGIIAAAVWFVYDSFQHARWGQTLGKRALSTRVVSAYDGLPISRGVAVKRAAVFAIIPVIPVFGTFFAVINGLWLFWDRRRQCLHDRVAHTIVVKTGQPDTRV